MIAYLHTMIDWEVSPSQFFIGRYLSERERGREREVERGRERERERSRERGREGERERER